MITYDRYTELLGKIIRKTITPTGHQIAARVYKSCGLTGEEIKLMEKNA